MKKTNENVKVTLTVGQIRRLIEESAEDDWLDAWLKDHPEDMEKTLAWIEKTKPGMNASGKESWARNILKKRHREGKLDAEHPTPSDKPEQANTLHELREPTPEEVERFSHEVKNYDVTDKGNPKEPDQRWFYDPKERRSIKFYKLVGFTEDGKVKVDVFSSTTYGYKEFKDGDYDDGQNHVWMDAEEHYKVNSTDKVGEAVGELKDGVVTITMRGKQKELGACQGKLFRSWRVYDKWYPAYGHGVWADRGYDRYGRRSYRESKKMNENGKVTLTLKQLKALVKEAKKVKQPRYTIAQYCDMKGLDADKLMAAMKAHRSILSPPITDRSMFLMSALDTYAERYADEMNNADTPIEVQPDDEAEDEVEVEVDKPYRDCGVTIHTAQGDREYGMKDRSETRWFDSKEDLHRWLKCGANETEGSEQDHFYSMLHQLSRGSKVVDYDKF